MLAARTMRSMVFGISVLDPQAALR